MSKTTIRPRPPSLSPGYHEKWKDCYYCGTKTLTCELKYDSGGTTEPTVGETFTGATSGDTGVVTEVEDPITGTWAGGDAAGYITLNTLTGYDGEQLTMFEDNENINGSTTGNNCLTCNGEGQVHIDGTFYPKRMMVKYRGHWMCHTHYKWRSYLEELDKVKIHVSESERGRE